MIIYMWTLSIDNLKMRGFENLKMKSFTSFLMAFTTVTMMAQSPVGPGKNPASANEFHCKIDPNLIGIEVISGRADSIEYFTTYLGSFKNADGDPFHVVSQFYKVQCAIQKHGHSRLLLLDQLSNVVGWWDVGMPENLPFLLRGSVVVFPRGSVADIAGTDFYNAWICPEPDDCMNFLFLD